MRLSWGCDKNQLPDDDPLHDYAECQCDPNCIVLVLVVVMRRRKGRSAKLVIDEDQSTTDSQAAFSRPQKNNSSIIQEQFSYNAGKVRISARKVTCQVCLI